MIGPEVVASTDKCAPPLVTRQEWHTWRTETVTGDSSISEHEVVFCRHRMIGNWLAGLLTRHLERQDDSIERFADEHPCR